MLEIIHKLKKRKFQKFRDTFASKYQHCNHCKKFLNIFNNEEIICALCGETFCNCCITNHQKYCYC